MTLKRIIKVPNPFLRKKAIPVETVTDDIRKLLDDMLETMYNANGVGLAATQIEENKRLIVMDCGEIMMAKQKMNSIFLINKND